MGLNLNVYQLDAEAVIAGSKSAAIAGVVSAVPVVNYINLSWLSFY